MFALEMSLMLLRFELRGILFGAQLTGYREHGAIHATHRGRALTVRGSAHMDHETLQALIKVYKARASTDLLSIIMDEAEGPQAQAAVLELLRSLTPDSLADDGFAPVRRKACHFCLNVEDFELADRLARVSDHPEDRALRARALHGLNREQEAVALYRQASPRTPPSATVTLSVSSAFARAPTFRPLAAKIISLNTYSASAKTGRSRSGAMPSLILFSMISTTRAVTFGDVAGLDDIKAEIRRRIVLPYLKPSLFERYKAEGRWHSLAVWAARLR